jgi:uncharacterized protein
VLAQRRRERSARRTGAIKRGDELEVMSYGRRRTLVGGELSCVVHRETDVMTMLKDQIRDDLTAAMRERDTVATSTLRMVLAAITNAEVAGDAVVTLDDDAVAAVLAAEAKRRNEAAEIYEANDRPDAAASERAEAAIIARYLPAALGGDELRDLVQAVVADIGASSPRDMGAVIAEVRRRGGSSVDGAAAAKEAKRQLTG